MTSTVILAGAAGILVQCITPPPTVMSAAGDNPYSRQGHIATISKCKSCALRALTIIVMYA